MRYVSSDIQAILKKNWVFFRIPHCVKRVRIPSFFGAYFTAFGLRPTSGKDAPEKLQIRTLLTQYKFLQKPKWFR